MATGFRQEGVSMESEIVFCERCGVSIPEHEIAASRQAAGGRDLCPSCIAPGASGDGDLRLYFCENCRVSIAVSDVLTGQAKPEGSGYHCAVCSQGTPAERVARRTAVEREMAAVGLPAPGNRPAGQAPLYFCDGCNASIPATAVATGRALVEGGRTWCETCRPRRARGGGAGFLPVAAAALLAAGATAAVFIVMDRQEREQARKSAVAAEDPLARIRQDVRSAREDASMARGEVADRADRIERDLERRVEALRADIKAAREAADRASAAAATGGTERFQRIETRIGELEEELTAGLQAVVERVDRVAAKADAAPPAGSGLEPPAPPGPPAAPEAGPGAGAPPPAGLGPDAARPVLQLKDKAAQARFAAAIELGKLGEKAVWPHLVEALRKDDDPFVRRACCRSLGELKAFEAIPALVDALSDGEEYVAKQASMVLREMSGQDFGYKQNQPKGERKKVADRARKWWEENKARLAPGAE